MTLIVFCTGRSCASVLYLLGAETGDNAECPGTPAAVTADSSFANSGAYSFKTTVSAAVPSIQCFFDPGSQSSESIDEYIRLDSPLPASVGSNALNIIEIASVGAGSFGIKVNVETTAGGVPSLQLYDYGNAVQVGSLFTIATGTVYRVVTMATITGGTNGEYKLVVCTGPSYSGAACSTAADTGAGYNTGATALEYLVPIRLVDSSSITMTWHADDILMTNTFSDLGPHEVLARQFTGAGTYTGWVPSGGGSCPANWNQTPFVSTNPTCTNSVSGSATCVAGATACQTGNTNFASNSGTGNAGHGAQTVSTSQTINAVKMSAYGFANASGVDSLVFIDSGSSETDIALSSTFGGGSYREVYMASAPTAALLIGAQAGVKHAATTSQDFLDAMWLMADVNTTSSTTISGGVIIP